jgi:hypothetical protein
LVFNRDQSLAPRHETIGGKVQRLLRHCILALGLASAAAAPLMAADLDSVAAMLDQQQIKYEVDKDKDYKIIYAFTDEKRSQVIYISGSTEDYQGMQIRTIFAPAVQLDRDRMDGQFKSLLEYNGKSKIGAWEIDGDVLFFSARVVEPITAEELAAMLNLVASVADDKEIEVTGKRDEL